MLFLGDCVIMLCGWLNANGGESGGAGFCRVGIGVCIKKKFVEIGVAVWEIFAFEVVVNFWG